MEQSFIDARRKKESIIRWIIICLLLFDILFIYRVIKDNFIIEDDNKLKNSVILLSTVLPKEEPVTEAKTEKLKNEIINNLEENINFLESRRIIYLTIVAIFSVCIIYLTIEVIRIKKRNDNEILLEVYSSSIYLTVASS